MVVVERKGLGGWGRDRERRERRREWERVFGNGFRLRSKSRVKATAAGWIEPGSSDCSALLLETHPRLDNISSTVTRSCN